MVTKKNTAKTSAKKKKTANQKSVKKVAAKTAKPVKTAPKKKAAAPQKTAVAVAAKSHPKGSREDQLQQLKLILLQQKAALLDEAEVALNELPGQTMFPDMGDQASAETDMNFMLRLRGREQRLLKKIDEALDRIENSTFGICEDCGEWIDFKRLMARPVTTMCIECKTLQEEEEKRREP